MTTSVGIGAVGVQMPEVVEAVRWLPDRDLAPVVLDPVRRLLVDPPAGTALEDDAQMTLPRDRVVGRPPGLARPEAFTPSRGGRASSAASRSTCAVANDLVSDMSVEQSLAL
jgi:hypothetical protein